MPLGTNFWWGLKVFNLFRLLENKILETLICIRKDAKADINSVELKFASRGSNKIFCKSWNWKWSFRLVYKLHYLHFRFHKYLMNSLGAMRTMSGVISWYVISFKRLFDLIACVLSLFIFLFSLFFCGFYYLLKYWDKFGDTYKKAVELFLVSQVKFRGVSS